VIRESEFTIVGQAIEAARRVQEFLWGDLNEKINFEEWLRTLRKRIVKLEEVDVRKPHASVEARKRLLQVAAVSVAFMARIGEDGMPPENDPDAPPYLHDRFSVKLKDVPAPEFEEGDDVRVPRMMCSAPGRGAGKGYILARKLVWMYDVCFNTDPDHLEAFPEEDIRPLVVRCSKCQARMHRCKTGDDDCWHCDECGEQLTEPKE